MIKLNELAKEICAINEEKGFNAVSDNPFEVIAKIHSEICEATEELFNWRPCFYIKQSKPEGFDVEIADALIRTLGYLALNNYTITDDYDEVRMPPTYRYKFHALLHLQLSKVTEALRNNEAGFKELEEFAKKIVVSYREAGREEHLLEIIKVKINYNKTRPYLHGRGR